MRWFIWLWAFPVGLISAWYVLSFHDVGYFVFSRLMHDTVFELYGAILGIAPENVPLLLAEAILLDSLIVLGVALFLRRKRLATWWQARRAARLSPRAN